MLFQPAILYIDDEQKNLDVFRRAFGGDYLVKTSLSAEEALEILKSEEFPLVIADQRMPGMSGIELCEKLITLRPESARIILTAFTETPTLLEAIHRGHVHDYIVKPWTKSELKPLLDKIFEDYKQRRLKLKELELRASQAERLEQEIGEFYPTESIIGQGVGLKPVMDTLKRAAPTDSTLLLLGETGTGKELLARTIHSLSKRSRGPFVPVHCAALAGGLLESELFGHEKGSFTGAERTRMGRFELAQGGTLFLDEVGEIPEPIQVKLLRVLQERAIERVGGDKPIPVNIRLVAATHRNLEQEVKSGRFREDLFYRLNVIALHIPPLRERKEDIPSLANYFLKKFSARLGNALTLPDQTLEYLSRYDWPGNVRELENVLERAAILSSGPTIDPEDLNLNLDEMLRTENVDLDKVQTKGLVRTQIQQEEIAHLTEILRQARGKVSEAARLMGIPRTTLFHRLKKYRLV